MSKVFTTAAHRIADDRALQSGIIAVDGPSGAGKSTFADSLVSRLTELGRHCLLIRTDDYATWDEPASWWPELERHVLAPYRRSHDVAYRPRVWVDGVPHPGPERRLPWAPLLILEGVTSARRAIASRLDRALWIEGPDPVERLERSVASDGEDQRDHLAAWQRFEHGWFAVDDTRSRCEILKPGCDVPTAPGRG